MIFRWRGWWLALLLTLLLVSPTLAHRSGCHRWHSCPSDRGTYVCGDLGYCSGCPDNEYCLNRQPRPSQEQQVPQELPKHKPSEAVASVQVVRVIDGDTIQVCCVFGDLEKVRYIGINTPEIHHPMKGIEPFGKEAAEANHNGCWLMCF